MKTSFRSSRCLLFSLIHPPPFRIHLNATYLLINATYLLINDTYSCPSQDQAGTLLVTFTPAVGIAAQRVQVSQRDGVKAILHDSKHAVGEGEMKPVVKKKKKVGAGSALTTL